MRRLAGRVALVTGAAGGIGAAIARRLAAEGAAVLVADTLRDSGERIVKDIWRDGGRAVYVCLDVTSEREWQAAVLAAAREFDGLDILVNSASIGDGGCIEELSLADWNRVITMNQTGAFLGMKAAADLLMASDHGSVINVSPVISAGDNGVSPAVMAASGAIGTLTRNVAARWADARVRVNSVHPGFIDSGRRDRPADASAGYPVREMPPMGYRGAPGDVAAGVAYLASDDASFATGLDLHIDGGYTQVTSS